MVSRLQVKDTVEKLIVVRTSLLLEKDSLMEWRTGMNIFSDEDEFIKFDDSVTKSLNYRVLKLFNYTEEWEVECLKTKCTSNLHKLITKYRYISFHDGDENEDRRVVNAEWNVGVRGGMAAQYVLVTQLVDTTEEDDLEPYYVNNSLYEMIRDSNNNSSYDLIFKS